MAALTELNSSLKRFISWFSPVSTYGTIRWAQTLFLYAISHGFMLASGNALYWDDWLFFSANSSGDIPGPPAGSNECTRWCIPLRSWLESQITSSGAWTMRAVTFTYFPITAWLLSRFLMRSNWLRFGEISTITFIWLLLPVNGARVGLVMSYYSFSVLLFALGAWMTLSHRPTTQLLSILPLFWSMFTASLQVFAFVLLAFLLAKLHTSRDGWQSVRVIVVAAVLIMPFVHRYLLPQVSSAFEITRDGYNSIQPAFMIRAMLFSALLICPLLYLLNRRRRQGTVSRESYQLGIGLAVLAAGTFPYLAVGHFANLSDWILPFLPDESDWNSRHQLLQPFGLAVVLSAIAGMFRARMKHFVAVILIASMGLNIATYSGYYLDAMKQREFITAVTGAKAQLQDVYALVIDDQTPRFNARGRGIRSYEWTAMLNQATNENFVVGDNNIQFCQDSNPTRMLTITASNGRLRSLVTGTIGISVDVAKLTLCDTSKMTTP